MDPPGAQAVGLAALALAGLGALAAVLVEARRRPDRDASTPRTSRGKGKRRDRRIAIQETVPGEARALHAAAGLLALSVLADSAVEHYKGSFENPGMVTPLMTSGVTAAHAARAAASRTHRAKRGGGVYGSALAVGATGLGFHLFNLLRRPGRLNWLNLFYAAPLGAPVALSLAGVIGLVADRVAEGRSRFAGAPIGRFLAGLTALGLFGTAGEAGLLHFRGAFQNPLMYAPVTVPPIGAVLVGQAALERRAPTHRRFARAWLGLTAALGVVGMGLHAYGVSRAMGGWRNWRQNVVDGPPLPAPPSFSALAIAALAALSLRDREDREDER
jgi:hypothetical protein